MTRVLDNEVDNPLPSGFFFLEMLTRGNTLRDPCHTHQGQQILSFVGPALSKGDFYVIGHVAYIVFTVS